VPTSPHVKLKDTKSLQKLTSS